MSSELGHGIGKVCCTAFNGSDYWKCWLDRLRVLDEGSVFLEIESLE